MLVFTANIERHAPGGGPSGKARLQVGAFVEWAAEIVDQRLAEVKAVAKRGSGNAYGTRVERFNLPSAIASAAEHVQIAREFFLQRAHQDERFGWPRIVLAQFFGRLVRQPGALRAGPRL